MGLSGGFSCLVVSEQGAPLEQISIAEPLAKNGETCLSPQAWEHAPCPEVRSDTHVLTRTTVFSLTFSVFFNSDLQDGFM